MSLPRSRLYKNMPIRLGKVGAQTHTESLCGVNKTLLNIAYRHAPKERQTKQKPKRKQSGRFTDEQVAHLRWLLEKEGWTRELLARTFNLDAGYTREVIAGYRNYTHVLPKRADDPVALFSAAPVTHEEPAPKPKRGPGRPRDEKPVTKVRRKKGPSIFRESMDRWAKRAMQRREYFEELRRQRKSNAVPENISQS